MTMPSAGRAGMMVALCTGSVATTLSATMAWPPRDSGEELFLLVMTSDLRSAPIITLSLASSNSNCVTMRLLRRAAIKAAR